MARSLSLKQPERVLLRAVLQRHSVSLREAKGMCDEVERERELRVTRRILKKLDCCESNKPYRNPPCH